ncbi:methyl-accepting chemotaxis protein [Rhizobium sp. PP-F2F-G48]|uniref:methyl-accepting chemotaxis protein n=1 Tax=Rhizobium sp. PP-F2F-G48 TaxID=2135651 RepID=UPI00104925E9|nr:methyl-accepting chemotaxis protein [Rhizobium sp. PP-F2F-G48]
MTTIRSKMIIVSVAMFALAGGSAGVGLLSSRLLTANVTEVSDSASILRNHMEADMMHDALRADVLSAMLSRDPSTNIEISEVKSDLAEHVTNFRSAITENTKLAGESPIGSVLKDLNAPLQDYIETATQLVDKATSAPDTMQTAFPDFKAKFTALESAMEKAGDAIQMSSEDVLKHSDALSTLVSKVLLAILAFSVASALVLLVISRRTITKPIETLSLAMQGLAAGHTESSVAGKDRSDEIGQMAKAVEVFRQAAIANRKLETEAEAQRQKSESDRAVFARDAEAAAQQRLQQATSSLATGLRRLADGDLSFQLQEPFAPDFESLRHDLNHAVSRLGTTLSSVAHAAISIDSGTREISTSSDDLSKRTEQQAASLEETAAALDQITANVSNASKRADEAREVAILANTSATRSGVVVAGAVGAMERIEESSGKISNIIGIIDEIAFQTNLLALNAGIEAARAGEAGRGFAVVAQEVRELAQRSAQAAKDIKELIRISSTEVASGVTFVRETGEALKAIETHVSSINRHMDAIATSSREQSVGLAEVNTAVNQMDQVTQRNAAMVEETNAASATLANESLVLHDLIAKFKLTNDKDVARTAGRHAA